MIRDLVTNGGFDSSLTGWTVLGGGPAPTWDAAQGHDLIGSCKFTPTGGDPSGLSQSLGTLTNSRQITLRFWAMHNKATIALKYRIYATIAGTQYLNETVETTDADEDEWIQVEAVVDVPINVALTLYFEKASLSVGTKSWYIDDVEAITEVPSTTRAGAVWELQKRRRDTGGYKHAERRYQEIINFALAQAPIPFWRVDLDTSIPTVAATTRYSLAALTAITNPRQVRRVFVHDGETPGVYAQLGRWTVSEDWSGSTLARTLYLALDAEPDDAGRTLLIEYYRPHASLERDDDEIALTDWEWVMAKSMVLLLLEADPAFDDPNLIERDLKYWDQQRAQREALVMPRRPAGKVRSQTW